MLNEMDPKRIDGKKVSVEIGQRLLAEIQAKNLHPSLGILCIGEDAISMSYKNGKEKFAITYGFEVVTERFTDEVSTEFIIEKLNKMQDAYDGVILQLPLPEKFKDDTDKILQTLRPEKDVDGSNPNNHNFVPPVVLAFQQALDIVSVDLATIKIAVVGLGAVVGMPIADYCKNAGAEVIEVGLGEHEKIKEADVVVSGVGKPNVIKADTIKADSILIDYGYSYVDGKCTGDFEKECYEKCKYYTPVPGCMGPLDVAFLFQNVLKSVQD
jgi:methylenetetrahydrofolate dehydrogenase (NADP+)/methenyltetrahydrofolate cyclohydrolase